MRLYVRQSRQQTASRVARIVDPTVDDAPAASQARNAPSPHPPPPLPDPGRAARQALADEVASTMQPLSVPSVPTEFAQRWTRGDIVIARVETDAAGTEELELYRVKLAEKELRSFR